ncbi:hypothetical protein MKAN_21450 [Mycobacterium kansasii ATCC 12478]|nr:hypothetical protein MKAN_21450 [Mycobacterium kansasii ATCC 12478]
MPVWEIAQLLGVGRSTAYRQLKAAESVAVQR